MNGILAVTRHGIRSWWKDKRAMMLGIISPVLLFLLFTWIFSGMGKTPVVLNAGWVDLDHSSASGSLERLLERNGAVRLFAEVTSPLTRKKIQVTAQNVAELVRNGELPLAIVVQAGLENQVEALKGWKTAFIHLLYDPSNAMQADILKGILTRAGFLLLSETLTGPEGDRASRNPDTDPRLRRFAADLRKAFRESRLLMGEKRESSVTESFLPISVEEIQGGKKENFTAAQQLAGIAVIFLLFSVIRAGGIILDEKQSGTLKRILSSPVNIHQLMLGKLLAVTSNGIVQIGILAAVGGVIFHLPILQSPVALFLVIAATAFCAACFGLVFATFCQTSEQVLVTAIFVILSMSLVGGSMFPSFMLPFWAQKLSVFTINGWAMQGFLDVLVRGMGTPSIWPELLALLGMAGLFLTITFTLLPRKLYE